MEGLAALFFELVTDISGPLPKCAGNTAASFGLAPYLGAKWDTQDSNIIISARSVTPESNSVVAPKIAETHARQLGIAHGVLDVLVTEISLQCAGIGAPVG